DVTSCSRPIALPSPQATVSTAMAMRCSFGERRTPAGGNDTLPLVETLGPTGRAAPCADTVAPTSAASRAPHYADASSTAALKYFPDLKRTTRRAGMSASSPVLGFLPRRARFSRT